jgi:hypothetical protein
VTLQPRRAFSIAAMAIPMEQSHRVRDGFSGGDDQTE